MGAFLEDAGAILEAAHCATEATSDPANFTTLIGPEGGIHMLTDSDWPLASLEAHHGARTIYRIHHPQGRVVVEGRCGARRCRLEHSGGVRLSRLYNADLMIGEDVVRTWNF